MAKLTKVFQNIFGSSAGSDQIAVFGSKFAGSPAFTTSPATAQSLSNFLAGWFSAAIVTPNGSSPCIEDMNALFYLITYQLAYYSQAGVPEWDSSTVYYTGSLAQVAGVIYVSLSDSNSNNLVTNATYWTVVGGAILQAAGDIIYGGTNGAQTRLPGNATAVKQYLTQTGTGSSSAAPVWSSPTIPTQQTFTSSGSYTPTSSSVLYVKVTVVGNGGTGGAGGSGTVAGSGGGGGGGTAIGKIAISSLSTPVTVTVGTTTGASCSFGSYVTATGGGTGGVASGVSNPGQGGGGGGGGGSSAYLTFEGADGGAGTLGTTVSGSGGQGGDSSLGGGGSGGNGNGQGGLLGGLYGSGGGGGSGGGSSGGAFAKGIVIIEEFYY